MSVDGSHANRNSRSVRMPVRTGSHAGSHLIMPLTWGGSHRFAWFALMFIRFARAPNPSEGRGANHANRVGVWTG